MRIVLLTALLGVALAGCAPLRPVTEASDYQLCQAIILGNRGGQEVVNAEQQRRGLDCNPYLASIQMGEQARQQNISNGLWMMQMARPQPMATPAVSPSVICTTRPGPSGTTSTVCQ